MADTEDFKARLFKPRLSEADIEVEGVGTFTVRALSRQEAMLCQAAEGTAAVERKMLALAVVGFDGEPGSLTEGEVGRWQKASAAGEMDPVTNKVAELSGMGEGAAKEAYKEFDTDPDAEFPVPAG